MAEDPNPLRRGKMHERSREVVPLTRELVREFLEERKVNYAVDEDGDFVAVLGTPYPQDLVATFVLDGHQKEVLQILIRVVPTPPMEEVEALRVANAWNAEKRWPKAFYRGGSFYLEWSEDWEFGVTPAILARTCDQVILGAYFFLEKLNGQDLASAFLKALKG